MPAKLREADCTKRKIVTEELRWVAISLIIFIIIMTACVSINRKVNQEETSATQISFSDTRWINQDQFLNFWS